VTASPIEFAAQPGQMCNPDNAYLFDADTWADRHAHEARELCLQCPARFPCLQLGIARGASGVYGGRILRSGVPARFYPYIPPEQRSGASCPVCGRHVPPRGRAGCRDTPEVASLCRVAARDYDRTRKRSYKKDRT
jgi:hypothetical protein